MSWNREICVLPEEMQQQLKLMCNTKVGTKATHILQQYPSATYLKSDICITANKRFCYSLFETDKCPKPWVPLLNSMTETWVFSEFNVQTYKNSGVHNTHKIPFGIDTTLFTPTGEKMNYTFYDKDDYVFITNGDYTERKNFEGLLEAYVKEFTNKDKVCLIIKTHSNGFIKRNKDECAFKLRDIVNRFNSINPPKILFFGDKIPYTELPKFYRAGHCFVLLSRGEGLGLPYAEALACGIPVISTTFGGQMEYLTDKNSLFVTTSIKVIDDLEYIKRCLWSVNHSWAHIDINDVRNKLRFAYEYRDVMQQKGEQGRIDIEKYSWDNTGVKIVERIFGL